ncbi:MAG TPA: proline--tRNA ligase [Anaerolineae bacterium]|nr:proline--tRNA ligase [Anaerolineae bacterium]
MRQSKLFSQTLRQAPAEAKIKSHEYLLRGGYVRQLAAGIFSYLPLAMRALAKIETIIREEMNRIEGQEIEMPVVHPADIWKESKRWYQIGPEMARFKDRGERDMVLGMTHEEIVGDIVRKEIQSYKQLPQLIYQLQTKFRDEPRARGGLIRVREFTMKDSYSLDMDEAGLAAQYRRHYQAYFNIFRRCGLPPVAVKSDVGMMGGSLAHEFMYLTPIGEDTLLFCDESGYAANSEIATFVKSVPEGEEAKALTRTETPGAKTIEALAAFFDCEKSRLAKSVFMVAEVAEGETSVERFVVAVVRGDMDLNETKLQNAVRAKSLRAATDEEIRGRGIVPGYGSPVGVEDETMLVVVDDVIPQCPNLIAGANEEDYHVENVNYGRDFEADIVTDIALAQEGDMSPDGAGVLRAVRGVEIGNIFKLGTRYSDSLGCYYLDENGEQQPIVMGSYGIGVGRILACLVEAHHDEYGIMWPMTVAPYQVHLVSLARDEEVAAVADTIYADLRAAGIEVLYDDRDESAGVKFNDADLLGMPLRLTVGSRGLKKGGVEMKVRTAQEREMVGLAEVVTRVQGEIKRLVAEIEATVREEVLGEG